MINKSLWNPPENEIPLNIEEQIAARYGSPGSPGSSGSFDGPQDKSAAAIISAIAGIASAVVGGVSAHRASQTNINLTREAYARNLEQWLRENAYNSPLAQRQRLMAAGFNPALMYGGAGSLGQASAVSPQMESATVNPYIFGNPLQGLSSDIANTALLDSQRELNLSQAEKNRKEAGFIDIQSQNGLLRLQVDKKWLDKLTEDQHKKFNADIDKVGVEINEISQRINNLKASESLALLEADKLRFYINNIQPAELDKIRAETNLTNNQAQELLYLMGQKLLLLKAQTAQANSSASLNKQLEKYNKELTDFQNQINIAGGGTAKVLVDRVNAIMSVGANYHQYNIGKEVLFSNPGTSSVSDDVGFLEALSTVLGMLKGII